MELIALVIFPLLVISSIRFLPSPHDKYFFGKEQTLGIKGILILMVFFHHFFYMVGEPMRRFRIYEISGPFAVGIFFLIAGYVTVLEFHKSTPSRDFWIKKINRLYLPLTIFSITFNNFLGGILWLYLFSWIAYRYVPKNFRLLFLIICNLAFIPFCMAIGLESYWYDRILPFSIGILYGEHKGIIEKYLNRKNVFIFFITILSGVLLPLTYCVYFYRFYFLPSWIYFTAFIVVSSVLVSFLMDRFTVKSRVFSFLGSLSYEMFCLHQANILLFNLITASPVIIAICSIMTTSLEAYYFQKFWNLTCAPRIEKMLK